MIKIKKANEADTDVLALLGRITWAESHGQYIDDKNNLFKYLNKNFSVAKTREHLSNPNNVFYIIYVDDLPVGYAKIILNETNENVGSKLSCRLERIFIQKEFIPLKIGYQLLTYVESQAKALQMEAMWLTVYIKNTRAIRFYERNDFKNVGELNFPVSGKEYKNIVFSKAL